ncbi:malic enzyme [Agrobacterium sp. SORGH_AS 745]|nr:malic enzyme [Agrobacterium sp. SORGH_AS_0745]
MDDKPKITQAMIDAYDEYTHLSLDRRKFMEKLSLLAGSGAAAAAIAPLLSANSARAAIVAPDDAGIVAEEVTYPAPRWRDEGLSRHAKIGFRPHWLGHRHP